MEIGNTIKFSRETRNYTEAHMAHELGISQSAYSKLEKGKIKLDAERLFRISVILQISLNEWSPHGDTISNQANGHKTLQQKEVRANIERVEGKERNLYLQLIEEKEKLITYNDRAI